MPMDTSNTGLYGSVVAVSEDFLGPAGERFIRRQITTHLDIEPEKLRQNQLPELIDWVRITFNVLTSDKTLVEDFVGRLQALSKNLAKKKATTQTLKR